MCKVLTHFRILLCLGSLMRMSGCSRVQLKDLSYDVVMYGSDRPEQSLSPMESNNEEGKELIM